MSKQTAVEWLVEQIEENHNFRFGNFYWAEIQQAKVMEREQIVEAFQCEWNAHNSSGKKYYENTYGKEASHEL